MQATFITMRLSHYCEKARWALDLAQVPYLEESHIPMIHRLFTSRNGGGSVPLLVLDDDVLTNSSAILEYADRFHGGGLLYPSNGDLSQEVRRWEACFDVDLGPNVRRWLYAYLLSEPKLMTGLWSAGVPRLETYLVPLLFPVARSAIRRGYDAVPSRADSSYEKILAVFEKVENSLRDGRTFLVGERFSAADLTFAALSAPLLLPPECPAAMPSAAALSEELTSPLARFEQSAAGEFVRKLYREERYSNAE